MAILPSPPNPLPPTAVRGDETAARDSQSIALSLVSRGAVLVPHIGAPLLVGGFRWVSGTRIAWFPAFGDRADDAHVGEFDHTEMRSDGMTFLRGRVPVARLAEIEMSNVDDPEDFLIGWKLWLEVAPLRRAFIESAFERLLDPRAA